VVTTLLAVALCLALFGAFLVCMEIGRSVGRRRAAQIGPQALKGFGSVEGALFALLGLLLAFTFSAAAARFDRRRDLIVDEANAIETAYLRLDVLPAPFQQPLRRAFGQYMDARMEHDRSLSPFGNVEVEGRVGSAQAEIWRQSVAAVQASDHPQVMQVVLPAVSAVFDAARTRVVAQRTHIPILIVGLLTVLALVCSVLAGYGIAGGDRRSWTHIVAFAALLAGTLYITLDYEFPRFGLIRVTSTDRVLRDLRAMMP
jgi:hypothetical protein